MFCDYCPDLTTERAARQCPTCHFVLCVTCQQQHQCLPPAWWKSEKWPGQLVEDEKLTGYSVKS